MGVRDGGKGVGRLCALWWDAQCSRKKVNTTSLEACNASVGYATSGEAPIVVLSRGESEYREDVCFLVRFVW